MSGGLCEGPELLTSGLELGIFSSAQLWSLPALHQPERQLGISFFFLQASWENAVRRWV